MQFKSGDTFLSTGTLFFDYHNPFSLREPAKNQRERTPFCGVGVWFPLGYTHKFPVITINHAYTRLCLYFTSFLSTLMSTHQQGKRANFQASNRKIGDRRKSVGAAVGVSVSPLLLSGPTEPLDKRKHVTLNKKTILLCGNVYEDLGKPSAVVLFFDKTNERIGVSSATPDRYNAFSVIAQQKGRHRLIRATPFCKSQK